MKSMLEKIIAEKNESWGISRIISLKYFISTMHIWGSQLILLSLIDNHSRSHYPIFCCEIEGPPLREYPRCLRLRIWWQSCINERSSWNGAFECPWPRHQSTVWHQQLHWLDLNIPCCDVRLLYNCIVEFKLLLLIIAMMF